MSLIIEHKGRTVDLSKPWNEMSTEDREILEDRRAAGENDRGRLIRFGYLSEEERRRLIASYGDLQDRFEPRVDPWDPYKQAFYIYFALIFGMALGAGHFVDDGRFIGWHAVWEYVLTTAVYWGIVVWILKGIEKARQERNVLYWEWRGYKPDKYGRKIG